MNLHGGSHRADEHREWYSRGYLPHFDHAELVQTITFRLGDALPAYVVEALSERYAHSGAKGDAEKRQQIEEYLDAGHGSCALRDERIAAVVEGALHHFDGQRYRLLAWVVMPNHVHTMIETMAGHPLGRVIHSWKSFTGNEANRILSRTGMFWHPDFFDRFIRDADHFDQALAYIHQNPVAAGLVPRAEDWRFSSARLWASRR